jgi:hypothetical protein
MEYRQVFEKLFCSTRCTHTITQRQTTKCGFLIDSAYSKTLTLLLRVLLEHIVCYQHCDYFRGSGYYSDIVHFVPGSYVALMD